MEQPRDGLATKAPVASPADEDGHADALARVAHELRTPISVSKGYAITIRDSATEMDPDTLKRCCDAIVRSLTSAQAILESLGETRSLESGSVQLDLSKVPVGDFVVETVRDLDQLIQPHKLSTVIKSDGPAWLDRMKVRQIISNLLSNAAKFSPPDAPILLEVDVAAAVRICVIDRGPGIAPDKMEKLFQKYERLDSDVKGTGLGLYISRGLARAHGGDLGVTSDGRSGCRFCLELPLDPEKAVGDAGNGERS